MYYWNKHWWAHTYWILSDVFSIFKAVVTLCDTCTTHLSNIFLHSVHFLIQEWSVNHIHTRIWAHLAGKCYRRVMNIHIEAYTCLNRPTCFHYTFYYYTVNSTVVVFTVPWTKSMCWISAWLMQPASWRWTCWRCGAVGGPCRPQRRWTSVWWSDCRCRAVCQQYGCSDWGHPGCPTSLWPPSTLVESCICSLRCECSSGAEKPSQLTLAMWYF